MTTATTAKKTATPRKRVAKAVSASQTVETAAGVSPDPTDVYVAPTGLSEGFEGNGNVKLDRLTSRALENLTELATDGNTNPARKYWIRVLAQYGVTVPFVPVAETE
jgi:hypothetical protein